MKRFALLTLLFALIVSFPLNAQDKKTKLKDNEAEVLFSVAIHCADCEAKLAAQLPFVKGVKDLKIDIDNQTIWFLYRKDKTDEKKLAEELDKLGYPGTVVDPEKKAEKTGNE